MEVLIKKGIPQRTGHEIVGHLVRQAEQAGVRLADLPDDAYAKAHPGLDAGVKSTLGVANAVKAFQSYGSTAPAQVEAQLKRWKDKLKA